MIILKTERLSIEEIELADAPFFLELLNSPGWIENIGDRGVRTIEDAEAYISQKIRPAYKEFGFGFYKMVLIDRAIPIGTVGIIKRPTLDHVDIGYGLLPEYFKQGYAFEASKKMLEYAMHTLKMSPILAITSKENIPSQRLLEKIGLSNIGVKVWEDGEELFLFSTSA